MKKITAFFLILCFSFSLCGCSLEAVSENNHKYLISTIGFDKRAKKTVITIEAVSVKTENIEDENNRLIIKGEGKTIASAMDDAQKKATQAFDLSHCGVIIISDNITDKELKKICSYAYNTEEITFSVYMVTTTNVTSLIESEPISSLAIGYDIMSMLNSNSDFKGYIYKNSLYEIESANEKPVPVFALPVITMGDKEKYLDGIAVFNNYRKVATLTEEETFAYSLITDNFSRGNVLLDGKSKKINSSKTHYKISKKAFELELYIKLNADKETKQNAISESRELIEKSQKYYGDIFGIGNFIYHKNSALWNEIKNNYEEKYRSSKVVVN